VLGQLIERVAPEFAAAMRESARQQLGHGGDVALFDLPAADVRQCSTHSR
jgi:hypothetical protein